MPASCSNMRKSTAISTVHRASASRAGAGQLAGTCLFDIDWQGAQQLYAKMPKDVVGVFVLPPSAAELKSRLERRAEDAGEVIQRRLRNARNEIKHWDEYDYVIVNEDFGTAFEQLKDILSAERAKRAHQADLAQRVEKLDQELAKLTNG